MPRVIRARHKDYTPDGVPVVVRLQNDRCLTSPAEFPGARLIDYTPSGIPILAVPWECCDAISDNYVEDECWPLGDGPGITEKAIVYLADVATCWSARGQWAYLTYAGGVWTGSVTLRGGTIDLTFECVDGADPEDPGKFKLTLDGCVDPPIELTAGYLCPDPLVIPFGQAALPDCCECPTEFTDTQAEVAFWVVANCKKVVWARHIDYTPDGIPIVARERPCDWDLVDKFTCANMTCKLVATITSVDGCECLEGDWDLTYASGQWENLGVGACDSTAILEVECTENEDGTLTLTARITCGATNSGEGQVIIDPALDLEDLDVTVEVELVDPAAGECTGDCLYTWNEMAAVWEFTSDTCTGMGCDTCPNGPDDNSPGSVDGETRTQPCTGSTLPACCIGTVSIRIMR